MKDDNLIETGIAALESISGLRITVIDNAGIFHTSKGRVIFSHARLSHRKNPVCYIGFCKKCRLHCRYEMNAICAKKTEPFVETCWKGITEIVVPLQQSGIHYGMLYAGSWRKAEVLPPPGLPSKFYPVYEKLPLLPEEEKIDELKKILTVFSSGILSQLNQLNALEVVPDTRGNKITEFIRTHASEKIELADLAEELNLSCSRTSYLLGNTLNKTFPELLNEERLRRVKTLLITSHMSLKEIAAQTGYSDEYYLVKMFKRQYDQTPGQYRKFYNDNPDVSHLR
jgi:AraC family transcriptional regulator